MPKSGARLKDVAELTGFSVNTVSLALRDSPRIPDDTRDRIKAAADQLNYLPNQVAKSLVSRETRAIGLILTDMQNPILTNVAQSVERKLAARGYTTLFATSNNNQEEEVRMIDAFRARRADGMLIFPFRHGDLDHIRRLRNNNYPVVLLVGDLDAGIDAVSMDERAGASKATGHLLATGHRRIALIDGGSALGNPEKMDGYRSAHQAAGIPVCDELLINPAGHSVETGYWAMDLLVKSRHDFSAVFATNDSLALGIIRYCKKHAIKVPEDLSVVGFDNTEFGAFAETALTTVSYDVERITSLAVDRVLDLIAHKTGLPDPRIIQLEPDLLVRESSAKAASAQ
ncbi:LacI family DNA-binding transcriptional regulator [Labrenzia sp. OB1]|uniref:LacI family DNA-binding transcriptional regulator n=1 Tax=Labrenzia sp. OB1 TaxID=1561204 RepID=UPI0007B3125F|nr:LacI family DNA-binding transcriptional regulator [Labrenzia sp. OB1]KZM49121.1 transcriptional regulator [Labrenzia sp. OB1]